MNKEIHNIIIILTILLFELSGLEAYANTKTLEITDISPVELYNKSIYGKMGKQFIRP